VTFRTVWGGGISVFRQDSENSACLFLQSLHKTFSAFSFAVVMDAKTKGRFSILARQSPGSVLLRIYYEISTLLCTLYFFSAFCLSCSAVGLPAEIIPNAEPVSSDSLKTYSVTVCGSGTTDIFIYDCASGIRLEEHQRIFSVSDTVLEFAGSGDNIAVAISDFPFRFNIETLQRYESLEQLELNIADDNSAHPVRTAVCEFTAGCECTLMPKALLCSIELTRVENLSGTEYCLEKPSVFLTGAHNSAELLRFTGFSQKYMDTDTVRCSLKHDIGIYPYVSGLTLHCYPNDFSEYDIGNPQTVLVLECFVDGRRYKFPAPLPPFGRGAGIKVSYEIRNRTDYSYAVY